MRAHSLRITPLVVMVYLACCSSVAVAQDVWTNGLTIEEGPTLGASASEFTITYSDRVPDGSFGIILSPGGDYSMRWQCLAFGAGFGLNESVDIMSEMRYCSNIRRGSAIERASGFGDLFLGLKVALWVTDVTSVAWVNAVSLPLLRAHADEELSPASLSMGTDQILVLSHTRTRVASTLQGGLHYGYDAGRGPEIIFHIATGAGYQLSSRFQPKIELHAERGLRDGQSALSVTAGVLYALGERLRLDVGLQITAHGAAAWRDRTIVARLLVAP